MKVLTRSPIVHVDGPRSVAAAFTVEEVRRLAGQAGLAHTPGHASLATAMAARVEPTMNVTATLDVAAALSRRWDAIVVGAGPAGALAARQMARQRARVLLVERRRLSTRQGVRASA